MVFRCPRSFQGCPGYTLWSACLVQGRRRGTGKTSLNRSELNSTSSVKVFIVRDKGFIASGNLVTVSLNGRSLGKLGVGEFFSSPLINQTNILKVETTGLMGIGIGDDTRHFNKKSENTYFAVQYKTKLFSEGWKIIEITKNEFESKF